MLGSARSPGRRSRPPSRKGEGRASSGSSSGSVRAGREHFAIAGSDDRCSDARPRIARLQAPAHGCPCYGWPYRYPCGYPGPENSASARTYNGVSQPGDRIPVPGKTGTDRLVVEEVSNSVVRLAWLDGSRRVEGSSLFLADAEQTVLVVQTLGAPPLTVVFEPLPDTTLAGVTVVWRRRCQMSVSRRALPGRPIR